MLPLWRDEVSVFVGPRRVALTHMRRGVKPTCIAEASSTVERGGQDDWVKTRSTLEGLLVQPAWRDADARVVIGDHWARYALVPWSGALHDESERQTYARHTLATVYGETSSQWTMAMSQYMHASARVVSALPTALLADIRSMLESCRLRLVSVQPQLVAAYNAWRHRLPDGAAWFVTVDDGLLAAAHQSDDGWDVVHSIRVRGPWRNELDRVRKLRRLQRGVDTDDPVYVHAPPALRGDASRTGGEFEWLEEEPLATASDKLQLLRGLYR